MKKILKEPFLHFIIMGIALFFLYGLVNDKSNSKNNILINDFDVSSLIASWEMQWKRPPTEKELQNLINLKVKQEVFYLEALNMNLDHNDEIIKRRLAQKMKFLSNDIASIKEASDEELKQYFNDHSEKYLLPYSYSLYQITFSPDKRENNYNDAAAILKQFPSANFIEMKDKGDQLPFSYFFNEITANELGLQLGSKFPEALIDKEMNRWIGPIPSGFGYHLVYITNIQEPRLPDFKTLRSKVVDDFEYDHQNEMNEMIYQELKKKYNIEFDIKSEDFDPKYVEYLENEFN
jgi:hypothetical protein